MIRHLMVTIFLVSAATPPHSGPEIQRKDFFVDGDSGFHLFVREIFIRPGRGGIAGEPLLLLHGARVPGLASFDLPVLEGSLAADLAGLGFDVYVTDIRRYGRSTRPKEMGDPPEFACAASTI
jgi:pimeloyl-ACP methyl ester carboxylesterase